MTMIPIARSLVIPVLDFSPHSSYNIRTLLEDLEDIPGEVICIFNSREVYEELCSHPRIDKYCYNKLNAGVSRSWNMGINMAEGKAVFILNADLHIQATAVQEIESCLFDLDRAVIAGPQGADIDYIRLCDRRYYRKGTFDRPTRCDAVSGFFFGIHLERFLSHGLMFDVQFSPCFYEEWDMGLQVNGAGLACYAVPVSDFEHHWGVSSADGSSCINYFGRTNRRDRILIENREKFKAKWHRTVSRYDASREDEIVRKQHGVSNDNGDSRLHRLSRFIEDILGQAYPEHLSELHNDITRKMLTQFLSKYSIHKEAEILDVGCGQGPALDLFRDLGYRAVGVTINDEDLRVCEQKGHQVHKMDQSFLDFSDRHFDLIWARHVVEHSIFPLFTLSEFCRVLKQGSYLYVEVPAPGTACRHETNKNHYSVLTKEMWTSLISRAGFELLEQETINFRVAAGPDEYWAFVCRNISA